MEEKIMVVFASRTPGKVIIISNKHRVSKLTDVLEIVGYNSDYVSVVQKPFPDKIIVYDLKGCRVDIIDKKSSCYF